MDAESIKKRIRAGDFIENNGRVLRAINMLRRTFNKLKSIQYALEDVTVGEFLDSVNFLHEEGYIHLRNIETKTLQPTGLADCDWRDLEAKLTGKGIRLLAGGIKDEQVKV